MKAGRESSQGRQGGLGERRDKEWGGEKVGGRQRKREKRGRRKARQREREGGFFDLSSILKKTMVLCISNYFR